jgi:hypothetical protein
LATDPDLEQDEILGANFNRLKKFSSCDGEDN